MRRARQNAQVREQLTHRDRARKVHPCLEKGDGFSRATGGGDNKDVLGVAQDGVVEENAEEHDRERYCVTVGGVDI
jgi:hypothetical protein